MPIGHEIKTIRRKLGLTQVQFAELYNLTFPLEITTTREDIAKYERDIAEPSASKYLKFKRMDPGK